MAEILESLKRNHPKEINILNTELTHCSKNPIEIDEEDENLVELFEQGIQDITAKPDFHFELGNIYYNFDSWKIQLETHILQDMKIFNFLKKNFLRKF